MYRERFEQFARLAAAITSDLESGRDAVQLGFAAAIRSRHTFRGTGSAEAWIWRIVVNEAKRLARKQAAWLLDDREQLNGDSTHARADPDGHDLWLRAQIAALPERQREVLFLRYFADLDYRTIAEILDLEVGTISATLSAAHTKLRKALREVER